jgi:sulfur carrier protein
MRLFIGQEEKQLDVRAVSDLLHALALPKDGKGIAIAVNDVVVSQSRWQEHELRDGDHIEIVRAVQGG